MILRLVSDTGGARTDGASSCLSKSRTYRGFQIIYTPEYIILHTWYLVYIVYALSFKRPRRLTGGFEPRIMLVLLLNKTFGSSKWLWCLSNRLFRGEKLLSLDYCILSTTVTTVPSYEGRTVSPVAEDARARGVGKIRCKSTTSIQCNNSVAAG